ncbi:hypothetical protein GQ55_5G289700 [Panicum hallii var. hallii]|uniref:Uncharacterized protein n=1 Tax=Panicum hallii var. hallii TaxID=1504633 RepID=A0A2T7DLA1_9POAL|nr:hypothetical protein GQ55_5G289700 [Panicum hallii var. hallii]
MGPVCKWEAPSLLPIPPAGPIPPPPMRSSASSPPRTGPGRPLPSRRRSSFATDAFSSRSRPPPRSDGREPLKSLPLKSTSSSSPRSSMGNAPARMLPASPSTARLGSTKGWRWSARSSVGRGGAGKKRGWPARSGTAPMASVPPRKCSGKEAWRGATPTRRSTRCIPCSTLV